jgi:hypothetical protein
MCEGIVWMNYTQDTRTFCEALCELTNKSAGSIKND